MLRFTGNTLPKHAAGGDFFVVVAAQCLLRSAPPNEGEQLMKSFRVYTAYAIIAAVAGVAAPTVFGQRMPGGATRDYGFEDMAKVFGKNQAFTATAEMSITDKQRPEPTQMETAYAFLNGNLRTEMDLTSMKGTGMSPQAVGQIKQMGMDRTISLYLGGKKTLYLVYPGLNAYCEVTPAQSKPTDKAEQKEPTIDISSLGKETVDGHSCVKNKVTFAADGGSQHEMLVWNASDMNDFPIKTEMQEGSTTITTHFRDIKLSAPDASLFEVPTGYKQYGSMQEMMMSNMQRFMPPSGGNN
jgi:hypothetical protein